MERNEVSARPSNGHTKEKPSELSLSKRISNENRKTQFNLGTDKPVTNTEASSHFRSHSIDPESQVHSYKVSKPQNFILGSHSSPYKTTASQSFENPQNSSVVHYKHIPSKNITFGEEKTRMVSIGHSEFTEKTSEIPSQNTMNSVKDHHRKCHFILGSYPADYNPTTRDYRAFSTTPSMYQQSDQSPNILLGNFKFKLVTEKQDNFTAKIIPSARDRTSSTSMKKTNFSLGLENFTPIATSAETYQKKELPLYIESGAKDVKGNITLGNSPWKCESSYQKHFYERENSPKESVSIDKKSNFVLGHDLGQRKTLAQESYDAKTCETIAKLEKRGENLVMGRFKSSFETMNSFYGKTAPTSGKTKMVEHSNAAQFSFGNDVSPYISKAQNDYGKVPEIPKPEKIINWNRACNITFGDHKRKWETTYGSIAK